MGTEIGGSRQVSTPTQKAPLVSNPSKTPPFCRTQILHSVVEMLKECGCEDELIKRAESWLAIHWSVCLPEPWSRQRELIHPSHFLPSSLSIPLGWERDKSGVIPDIEKDFLNLSSVPSYGFIIATGLFIIGVALVLLV